MAKPLIQSSFNLNGRGILGRLVSEDSEQVGIEENLAAAQWVSISEIRPGAQQPRQCFSQDSLENLVESFKINGFKGALNVRKHPDGGYELVAGERRWRAANLAGINQVRCIIDDYSDEEALEFALIENLQREDLSKLEETEGILHLIEMKLGIPRRDAISIIRTQGHSDRLTRSDVAPSEQLIRIDMLLNEFNIELQTFRTKNLRTLFLPEELKEAHLHQHLAYSCALEINKIKDAEERHRLLQETLEQKLSFRQVKQKVNNIIQRNQAVPKFHTEIENLEIALRKFKKNSQLLEKPQKRKRFERLLKEMTALLEEGLSNEN